MLFHFFNLLTTFLLMIVVQKLSDPVNLATFAGGWSLLQLKTYWPSISYSIYLIV